MLGRISVLVTTFERNALLAEALVSLQDQDLDDWDAVVVDNGRDEATRAQVRDAADPRIRYVAAPRNLGECAGRNLALRHAHGAYVCYLDDDDRLPEGALSHRLAALRAHPGCAMVYGEYRRIDGRGRPVDGPQVPPAQPYLAKRYYDALLERLGYERRATYGLLKQLNFVRGGTPLLHTAALRALGGFDPRLPVYGDYDLWLRVAARFPICFTDEVVYEYRLHDASVTARADGEASTEASAIRVCAKHTIRRSLQFARHQRAIDRFWNGHPVMSTQVSPYP